MDKHYLADPAAVEFIDGVPEAMRAMKKMGLGLIVISNQSGIARGYFSVEQMQSVNSRLKALLAGEGVQLDGIYVCPHDPMAGCDCRKPQTGLVDRAVGELHFDPVDCFVIGDRASDIELGRRLNAVAIHVQTGLSREGEQVLGADYSVANLVDAVPVIKGYI